MDDLLDKFHQSPILARAAKIREQMGMGPVRELTPRDRKKLEILYGSNGRHPENAWSIDNLGDQKLQKNDEDEDDEDEEIDTFNEWDNAPERRKPCNYQL